MRRPLVPLIVLAALAAPAFAVEPHVLLAQGKFDDAAQAAQAAIAKNAGDARAHAVLAIATYKTAAHQLMMDVTTLFAGLEATRGAINLPYLRFALGNFDKALASIDADLAAAAQDPRLSVELCLACWRVDWNRNGRVDSSDEKLMQIEVDADGHDLPEDDPRRTPTFRFDVGDVYWARAMIAFQQAFVDLALAYRWSDLADAMQKSHPKSVRIALDDAARVRAAQAHLLAAIDFSDRARREYLAETDDDREWLPSPKQKSHPMPLPVDAALYKTWETIAADARRLVRGEEGLPLGELKKLAMSQSAGSLGFLDVGKLFSAPKDLTFAVDSLEVLLDHPERADEKTVRALFGSAWSAKMKPSPLVGELHRMRGEIDRGEESMERKLRYLFWVN